MTALTRNVSKFSDAGLPFEARVDILSLTDRAAWRPVTFQVLTGSAPLSENTAVFVQNASTDHVLGPAGIPCYVRAATVSSSRVASLGAGSYSLYVATTDGTTKTLLTNTVDPEAITANVGSAFTMAATNRLIAATDVFFLRATADNNAVGTDARSVRVTLWLEPQGATTSTKTTGV